MANNQTVFNATVVAVQQNQTTLAPYLSSGTLNLGSRGITDTDCTNLATALKNNTSVQSLDLSNNAIGASGTTALAQALQVNTKLQSLDLGGNTIGDNGATALAQALQVNTALQTLFLNSNAIGASGGTALAQALQVNTKLQYLALNSNAISASGGAAFVQTLQINTVLQTLQLYNNVIGASSTIALAQALQVNTALQSLNLQSNSIGDSGAIALGQALQINTALQELYLFGNAIGDSGATALAKALQVNTKLQYLDLWTNSIGDNGATALAQALQMNTALQTLNLQSNSIGTIGTNALINNLACNYVLRNLFLDTFPTQLTAYLNRNRQCAAIRTPTLTCPVVLIQSTSLVKSSVLALNPNLLQIATPLQSLSSTSRFSLNGNFTITNMNHGQFVNITGQALSQFSQAAVNASQVFIQTDNSGLPFSCNITASVGNFSTCEIPLIFSITNSLLTSTSTPSTSTTSSTTSTSTSTMSTMVSPTIMTSTNTPFISSSSSSTTSTTPTTSTSATSTMMPTSTTTTSTTTMPLTSTPFTTSATTSRLFTTTASLPFTSTSRPTTSAVAANLGASSSSNLGTIVGGVAAGVVAFGTAVFALRRYRQKQSTQIDVLPTNTINMEENPLYVIPLDQQKWDPAATLRRDAQAVPTAWDPSLYTTDEQARIASQKVWAQNRYAVPMAPNPAYNVMTVQNEYATPGEGARVYELAASGQRLPAEPNYDFAAPGQHPSELYDPLTLVGTSVDSESYEQFVFKNPAHPAAAAAPRQWNLQTYATDQKALVRTQTKWDPTKYNAAQHSPRVDISAPYETADDDIA